MKHLRAIRICAMLCIWSAAGDAALDPVCWFADSMVLQRNTDVPVWGWAPVGEGVRVTFNGQVDTCTATTVNGVSGEGMWRVVLDSMDAGGPYEMHISTNTDMVTLTGILVGDVWICAGQSNMEIPCGSEMPDARYADIRHFTVYHAPSDNLVYDIPVDSGLNPSPCHANDRWYSASASTLKRFSKVGFIFGRDIHIDQKVPVGLIDVSYGGTSINAWHAQGDLYEAHTKWVDSSCQFAGGRDLFRGHIYPMVGLAIRGVLWWQGEADACGYPVQDYARLFHNMIQDWRSRWGYSFPFLYVQLQGIDSLNYALCDIEGIRDAQFQTLVMNNTAMAVIADTCHGLHPGSDTDPPQQRDAVAHRLSLAARKLAYDENIEYSGPVFARAAFDGSQARVFFTHTGSGLRAKYNGMLSNADSAAAPFEVAGPDMAFMPADARIEGRTVVVSGNALDSVAFIRYGWAKMPDADMLSLLNEEGLAASPFQAPFGSSPYFYTGYADSSLYPVDSSDPPPPDTVVIHRGRGKRVLLSWNPVHDSESLVTHYNLYRNGLAHGQVYTTVFSDTSLNYETSYTYRVAAVNLNGIEGAKSTPTQLTTGADTLAPRILSVSADSDSSHVRIRFDEKLDPVSAVDTSNFSFGYSPCSITNAALNAESTGVILTVNAECCIGNSCMLTVAGVGDRAQPPNTITSQRELWGEKDSLFAAFAFGRNAYSVTSPNGAIDYIKVTHNQSGAYSSARGYGYTEPALHESLCVNRGRIGCEIYDQHITPAQGAQAIFRIDLAAGRYRFVAVCGDAKKINSTTLQVCDTASSDTLTLIEGITTAPGEYAVAAWDDKLVPACKEASFIRTGASPTFTVTGDHIFVIQSSNGEGGALNLLELYKYGEQPIGARGPYVRSRLHRGREPMLHTSTGPNRTLRIRVNTKMPYTVDVVSIKGRIIAHYTGTSPDTRILSEKPAGGIYCVRMKTAHHRIMHRIVLR